MHGDDEPYGSVQRVENFDKWPAKLVITDNVGITNRAAARTCVGVDDQPRAAPR